MFVPCANVTVTLSVETVVSLRSVPVGTRMAALSVPLTDVTLPSGAITTTAGDGTTTTGSGTVCVASITMPLELPSEPGVPGAGRVKLAALPAASLMVPPLSDRASAPA